MDILWLWCNHSNVMQLLLRVCTVEYAETFRGEFHWVAYCAHLYLVCAVCDVTISRHIHVSKPTFWRSLLTHYAYSSTRTPLILCVIALNINYQRSKGVKHTHHYVRAIYNCKMRLRECLVKYEQSSIESVRLDWLAHNRVCKIESCQTTQE